MRPLCGHIAIRWNALPRRALCMRPSWRSLWTVGPSTSSLWDQLSWNTHSCLLKKLFGVLKKPPRRCVLCTLDMQITSKTQGGEQASHGNYGIFLFRRASMLVCLLDDYMAAWKYQESQGHMKDKKAKKGGRLQAGSLVQILSIFNSPIANYSNSHFVLIFLFINEIFNIVFISWPNYLYNIISMHDASFTCIILHEFCSLSL